MRNAFRFSQWRIQKQIIVSMIWITVVLAGTLSLTGYTVFKDTIQRNYLKTYENNLLVLRDVVDLKLENAIDLVRETATSDDFLQILKTPKDSETRYFNSRATRELEDIWAEVETQNLYIVGVFLFDSQGRFYKRIRGTQTSSAYLHYYDADQDLTGEWVDAAIAARGKEVFYGGDLLAPDSGKKILSYAKQIIDPNTLKPVGIMVVNVSTSILRNALFVNDRNFKTDTLMLLDAGEKQLIYFTGEDNYADKVISGYLSKSDPGKYLYSSVKSTVTGWVLAHGIAASDLNQMSRFFGYVILVTALALVALIVLLSVLISRIINKPLQLLTHAIGNMREDTEIVELFDDSEIGHVGRVLKETVHRNLELRDRLISSHIKEREAELLLLQAQINPHFLYNTLDSIYCMAIIDENVIIADMVSALSELFKMSLSKGRRVIRVREELDYIQKYMSILQMRYGDRFTLILHIDDDIWDLFMMKFLLQPFVENAMYHGLEPKMGKGIVKITGTRANDELHFIIADDGVGIHSDEDIYKGYGVGNVVDRIHLLYGEEYGIHIKSRHGEGTQVTVRIPILKMEDQQ